MRKQFLIQGCRLLSLIPLGLAFQLCEGQSPNWKWAYGSNSFRENAINGISTDLSGNILSTGYYFGDSISFAPGVVVFNQHSSYQNQKAFIDNEKEKQLWKD